MKYLIKFNKIELVNINEHIYSKLDIKQLHDYCEMYLAELIDKGYMISIESEKYTVKINIFGPYKKNKSYTLFSWNEIKDEFIPFFDILQTDYNLDFQIRDQKSKHITLHIGSSEPKYYNKIEIENIPNIRSIVCVQISIKQKGF